MSSSVIDITINKIEEKMRSLVTEYQALEQNLRETKKDYKTQILELKQEKEALSSELAKVRIEYGQNSSELTSENELLKYRYQQLIDRVESLEKNF